MSAAGDDENVATGGGLGHLLDFPASVCCACNGLRQTGLDPAARQERRGEKLAAAIVRRFPPGESIDHQDLATARLQTKGLPNHGPGAQANDLQPDQARLPATLPSQDAGNEGVPSGLARVLGKGCLFERDPLNELAAAECGAPVGGKGGGHEGQAALAGVQRGVELAPRFPRSAESIFL